MRPLLAGLSARLSRALPPLVRIAPVGTAELSPPAAVRGRPECSRLILLAMWIPPFVR